MAHVLVLGRKDNSPGEVSELGSFEDPELEVLEGQPGRIWLSFSGARAFTALIGHGFMHRSVHLVVDGEKGYANCRMTRRGGPGNGATFEYADTFDPNE